jgi:hypothetical protein
VSARKAVTALSSERGGDQPVANSVPNTQLSAADDECVSDWSPANGDQTKFGEQVSLWDVAMLNGKTAIIFGAGGAIMGAVAVPL